MKCTNTSWLNHLNGVRGTQGIGQAWRCILQVKVPDDLPTVLGRWMTFTACARNSAAKSGWPLMSAVFRRPGLLGFEDEHQSATGESCASV